MILSTRSRCAASHSLQGLASVADWSSQHKFKEEIPSGGPRHGACPTDRPGARRLATRARRAGGPPARHSHAGRSSPIRVRFWSPKGSVACKRAHAPISPLPILIDCRSCSLGRNTCAGPSMVEPWLAPTLV